MRTAFERRHARSIPSTPEVIPIPFAAVGLGTILIVLLLIVVVLVIARLL